MLHEPSWTATVRVCVNNIAKPILYCTTSFPSVKLMRDCKWLRPASQLRYSRMWSLIGRYLRMAMLLCSLNIVNSHTHRPCVDETSNWLFETTQKHSMFMFVLRGGLAWTNFLHVFAYRNDLRWCSPIGLWVGCLQTAEVTCGSGGFEFNWTDM